MIRIHEVFSPRILKKKIKPGSYLLSINKEPINDYLDFQYFQVAHELTLNFLDPEKKNQYSVFYDQDEELHFDLEELRIKSCANKCVFCFIDQLPKGLRKELYVKDEDYRLSFTHGNFITGTSLTKRDIKKIIHMRLAPIYLSVHTTNGELRKRMLNNPRAGEILELINTFSEHEIDMHTQIVLCPGLNDGNELEKTIEDLAAFHPFVRTIGIVPVGLSSFRDGLYPLRTFKGEECAEVIKKIHRYQEIFLNKKNERIVFPADEFYLKSQTPFPPVENYEEMEQYENGIGMSARLMDNFSQIMENLDEDNYSSLPSFGIVTGRLGAAFFEKHIIAPLKKLKAPVTLFPIKNRLFGPSITITGLLSGHCLIRGLQEKKLPRILFLPENCLNYSRKLLDDLSIADLENALGPEIRILDDNLEALEDLFYEKTH